jgi:hypothetical protein
MINYRIPENLINFYRRNGVFGLVLTKLLKLTKLSNSTSNTMSNTIIKSRGGQLDRPDRQIIEAIIKDEQISDRFKRPYRQALTEEFFDNYIEETKDRVLDKLRKSLIVKSQFPVYSNLKSKSPYLIMTPILFSELTRISVYKAAGLTYVPPNFYSYLAFSMPSTITFTMIENYLPDEFVKAKLISKYLKWTSGLAFYSVAFGVDCVTKGFEQRVFKTEIPINIQETLGTIPKMSDIDELKAWSQSFQNDL